MEEKEKMGVTKKMDNLGRVVIPKDFRTLYEFSERVEVVPLENGVLVRNPKYVLVEKEN